MFCPAGYRPAAELWTEYAKQRLEAVYRSAVKSYRAEDGIPCLFRGSPLDICEHHFLKTLTEVGLFLASPDREIVRVGINIRDGSEGVLSLHSPFRSTWLAAASALQEKRPDVDSLMMYRFRAWDSNDAWSDKYPDFSEIREDSREDPYLDLMHHALPAHFVRPSYVIAPQVPSWSLNSASSPEVAPIINSFAGWAVCLDDATYHGEWQEYLSGQKHIYPQASQDGGTSARGRPRMALAREAFAAMGHDKGALSWPDVGRRIEQLTGVCPSPRALRRWRDEHEGNT